MSRFFIYTLFALFLFTSCNEGKNQLPVPKMIVQSPERSIELSKEIQELVATKVDEGLELTLWANDSLVTAPIAISIDPLGGIYYTSAVRMRNSEFDIRGHRNWMTESISWETVEDRRQFLKKTFPIQVKGEEELAGKEELEGENDILEDLNDDGVKDWRDLAHQKEEVWRISDENNDGYADKAFRYLEDFNEEITDVANGISVYDGEVYINCSPEMWKTSDTNGDGMADKKEALADGFAIHVGFSGHGMSGAIIGPDGRLWWGIGDIGMNYTDKEGKQHKYPNQGVIVRCEQDGSNFEVYAAGLRNTHEFVFDKYGNLITEDNDGDHPGERERLVHLIDGSDSGWRANWQYGKYTDPDNNKYKVWMDEKMSIPHWDGQAAYFLPPIANYVNGPTGMVYNPGTALGKQWYNHFFISEFRGAPTRSPIHAFTLKPAGASFELGETKEVVSGLLPTGLDFGPDGALYFGDWIDGWNAKNYGRIWKLDVPGQAESRVRLETKMQIEANFKEKGLAELSVLLGHQDMRVRQKAQFEIVKREDGIKFFLAMANGNQAQMTRIHALWGIGQLARKDRKIGENIVPFLEDTDPEMIVQAIKLLGDIRYVEAADKVMTYINDSSPRTKLHAAEATGRLKNENAIPGLTQMLVENDDKDKWLRHAGIIALARIGNVAVLKGMATHPSLALRTAAVVALRRLRSPEIAVFLNDKNEFIVREAARAINDDYSIPDALPALADLISTTSSDNEALVRRIINANLRVGEEKNLRALLAYAMSKKASAAMKGEALSTIATWSKPSEMDRVDGRYRGKITRDPEIVKNIIAPVIENILSQKSEETKIASIKIISKYRLLEQENKVYELATKSKSEEVLIAGLQSLKDLQSTKLISALNLAFDHESNKVKGEAIKIIPEAGMNEKDALQLLGSAIEKGSISEIQAAYKAVGSYNSDAAKQILKQGIVDMENGKLESKAHLELIESIEKSEDEGLISALNKYHEKISQDDPMAKYDYLLEGGNHWKGSEVFNEHEGAQCNRCHTIFEHGGDAGPGLAEVGDRLSKKKILESLVYPSAVLAPGYGAASITLNNGEKMAANIVKETEDMIIFRMGSGEQKEIAKSDIKERTDIPSSMPSVEKILTKRELRDLVKYLSSLKIEEEET